MDSTWLLLICRLADVSPHRRAQLARAVNTLGALCLADDVWLLPERTATTPALGEIAATARVFGGEATLVRASRSSGLTHSP